VYAAPQELSIGIRNWELYTSMSKSWPLSRLLWVSPMRMGKIALLSIRATLTQSEAGVWRFSCNACLIDAGAALERAAMAATIANFKVNILRCSDGDVGSNLKWTQSSFQLDSSQMQRTWSLDLPGQAEASCRLL
jgi:hypothetical protein